MNTSEHEIESNIEVIKEIEDGDVEPAFYNVVDAARPHKSNASFNYSARKKIEEYLENKTLGTLTYDAFEDIG